MFWIKNHCPPKREVHYAWLILQVFISQLHHIVIFNLTPSHLFSFYIFFLSMILPPNMMCIKLQQLSTLDSKVRNCINVKGAFYKGFVCLHLVAKQVYLNTTTSKTISIFIKENITVIPFDTDYKISWYKCLSSLNGC